MLDRYSQAVIRFRWAIVLFWVSLGAALPFFAPKWSSVTHDGDFAYLPEDAPTVAGQRLLDTAFRIKPPKSQIVVGLVRADAPLEKADFAPGYDIARRLINLYAARTWRDLNAGVLQDEAEDPAVTKPSERALKLLNQAIEMSGEQESLLSASGPLTSDPSFTQSLAVTFLLRAEFTDRLATNDEEREDARSDRQKAVDLEPELGKKSVEEVVQQLNIESFPVNDLWTWRSDIVGDRLQDDRGHSRLVVLHFPTEFMATGNIAVLERVERELAAARQSVAHGSSELGGAESELIVSGSAAVGADLLRSSARSIRNTDWLTAALVLIILAVVYRSPLMVAIPMAVIFLSLQISISLLAILAQAAAEPNSPWDFKVFTTTRVFVVVLLYGAGTDACLFLISRFREECGKGADTLLAVRKSLVGVGGALLISSGTTILGLSMLYFAEFGKYHYTGPAIAFCLLVATLACLSLGPALLAVLGPAVYWPWPPLQERRVELAIAARRRRSKRAKLFGREISEWVVRRPALVIAIVLAVLVAPTLQGIAAVDKVSYDVLEALGRDLPSRRGTDTLRSLYEPGEAGPIILLVSKPGFDPNASENRDAILGFHRAVFTSQVASVRGLYDPMGVYNTDEVTSVANLKGWQTRVARASQATRAVYVGQRNSATVLKWEVVPRQSPFSREGYETLEEVERRARAFLADPSTPLRGARLDVGGVTAALRDLEVVTKADYRRMRWLVTISVLGSLLLTLRRPIVSVYIVGTVLLGFFVTMGLTYWTFAIANLNVGYLLDWRVPLFLFVILVAVGADYSVYLATRVFEEQAEYGPFTGLRRAVVQTGGIISSCGVIMAGTFISMTSGIWALGFPSTWKWPTELFGSPTDVQRGIVELGFALALGILLDTFVVRTILLPAFFASLAHWKALRELRRQKQEML